MDVTVGIDLTRLLCEGCLGVDGCHAEEGDDPHPENSTGTADQNGAAGTDDVTRTDLCGNGGCQRLEGGKTVTAFFALAEHTAPAFAKAAYLHEAGLDGVKDANADQKDDEDVGGDVAVCGSYNVEKKLFHDIFPFCFEKEG